MKICFDNTVFILVRPLFLGNIGSAARALKNFGFSKMRLVDPPKNYKDSEARRMCAGAFDVLKRCETFLTLTDALADVSLAVGTTSGQARGNEPAPLLSAIPHAIQTSRKQMVAFAFGGERDGLTKAELERCHTIVTIPTNPEFPALNISQAIGIIAYELTRQELNTDDNDERTYPTGRVDDQFFAQLDQVLDQIDFTRRHNRAVILRELRTMYQRIYPSEREAGILSGIVRRLARVLEARQDTK